MQKPLDNWCPDIYRGLYVGRHNTEKISVAPCCQSDTQIFSIPEFDFDKNSYLTTLRDQFAAGQKPKECNRCWYAEEAGIKSRRQGVIEFYNINNDHYDVVLESLDYSTTWACNLACIMCGPHNSSTWAKELNLSKQELLSIGRYAINNNNFLLAVDTSEINKLHFNGGEPLINNDHANFLNTIIKNNKHQLHVSYNTNGTIFPTDNIIDLWKSINLVKLFFSIDAIGAAYDYVRWPSNWQQTADNMLKLKLELPSNIMFGFNVTVGCYNLLEIAEIWQWFNNNMKTNREGDQSDFNWQLATNFNPINIKKEVKLAVIDQLDDIDTFTGLVTDLKNTLDIMPDHSWINKLDVIDQRRGTNWKNSLSIGQYY